MSIELAAAQAPSQQDLARVSPLGNYLAARHASQHRDAEAASAYYRAALRSDPKNPVLLERAFVAAMIEATVSAVVRRFVAPASLREISVAECPR